MSLLIYIAFIVVIIIGGLLQSFLKGETPFDRKENFLRDIRDELRKKNKQENERKGRE